MAIEIVALESNQTWSLVDLPLSKKPIGCKLVYKIKLLDNWSIEHYKAQLMAKG